MNNPELNSGLKRTKKLHILLISPIGSIVDSDQVDLDETGLRRIYTFPITPDLYSGTDIAPVSSQGVFTFPSKKHINKSDTWTYSTSSWRQVKADKAATRFQEQVDKTLKAIAEYKEEEDKAIRNLDEFIRIQDDLNRMWGEAKREAERKGDK